MPQTASSSVEVLQQQLTICRSEIANLRTKLRAMSAQFNRQCKEILQALKIRNGTTEATHHQARDCESADSSSFTFQPIGYVQTAFPFKNGTPRQGCICPDSQAVLILDKQVFTCPEHSLEGLDKFSHVWLLSVFNRNTRKEDSGEFAYRSKVQPPRLGGQTWGVLASRSPHRPCPVGLTLARLHSVQGSVLHLSGVDLVDGTPILDIKPYLPQYDSPQQGTLDEIPDVRWASWIEEATTLAVDFTPRAREQLSRFHGRSSHPAFETPCSWCLQHFEDSHAAARALECLLKADPRSIHRKDNCSDRLYYCVLDSIHVTAWFDEGRAEVLKLQPRVEGEGDEPAGTSRLPKRC
ncbi:tRNA (adenine(37)-N6)-methyltransferase [Dermacentor silvarum]|uniref:tRNA (adenine(37)-N6)-methyltransferase n=1 Tax=Dermacentor silvarum TaxID=543639 RepID=UPI001898141E|nr:tRNA (adenine(37)-N6)-methyltransferase [Dermacentor silvarum]